MERANNSLKSKLLHEQLRHSTYRFIHLEKEMLLVLNEYNIHKSIFKAAFNVGVDLKLVIKWFIEGQKGNPDFKNFYLTIMKSNGINFDLDYHKTPEIPDYEIKSVDGSWIYTASIDGEKVSVISSDYEQLKQLRESIQLKYFDIYDTLVKEDLIEGELDVGLFGITREHENEVWAAEMKTLDEIKVNFDIAIGMIESGEAEKSIMEAENW